MQKTPHCDGKALDKMHAATVTTTASDNGWPIFCGKRFFQKMFEEDEPLNLVQEIHPHEPLD